MAASKKATKTTKRKAAPRKTAAAKSATAKAGSTKSATAKTAAAKRARGRSASTKSAPAKSASARSASARSASTKASPRSKSAAAKSAAARKRAQGNGRAASIDGLAQRLGEHRREILHLYRHDLGVGLDAFRDGDDEIDRANFDSDRDLALSLSDTEREVLLQIEEALHRIDRGEYGSCTSCSKEIGEQRLHAIPWARYCIDCQEMEEKGLL